MRLVTIGKWPDVKQMQEQAYNFHLGLLLVISMEGSLDSSGIPLIVLQTSQKTSALTSHTAFDGTALPAPSRLISSQTAEVISFVPTEPPKSLVLTPFPIVFSTASISSSAASS
jgi:hypothetical protein